MVDVTLTDTGKQYVGQVSAPASEIIAKGDNGVAGTALVLKGADISFTFGVIGDNSPSPGMKRGLPSDTNYDRREWATSETQQNGLESPAIKITGYLKADSQDDMKTLGRLTMMKKTKGYKTLGSTGTYSSNPDVDFGECMINYIKYDNVDADSADHGSPTYHTTVSSINVRINGMSIKRSRADGTKIVYTLDLTEEGKRFA